jgi:small Trp-rich protein
MYFLILGVALMVMKYLEFGAIAGLSWLIVLSPFAMAVAWWAYADRSGYTKRREMDKMDKRRDDRIEKQRAAMGMLSAKKKGPKR